MFTTHTPQVRSLSRSTSGMPLKMADSRTCDRPTKASGPWNDKPAGIAGQLGDRPIAARGRIERADRAGPDSNSHSRPSYQRGECGMESPRAMIRFDGNVDQDAAVAFVRPPAARRVRLAQRRDVTHLAVDQPQAVQVAAVFRGQVTDERRPPAGTKTVAVAARAKTRKRRVDEPQLVAHPGHLVDLDVARGVGHPRQKQASCLPAGSSLRATAGRLWYSQISIASPIAKRLPRTANPIGLANPRKCVFNTPPSARNTTNRPA